MNAKQVLEQKRRSSNIQVKTNALSKPSGHNRNFYQMAGPGKGVIKRVAFQNSSSSQEVSKPFNSSKSQMVPEKYKLSSIHEVSKPFKLSKSQDVSHPHKSDVPRKRQAYTRLEDEEVQEEVQTQPNIPRKRQAYTRLEDEEVQTQPNIPRKRQAYTRLEDEEVQEEVQTQPNIPRKRQAYMRLEDEEVQEEVQTESVDHEYYSEDDREVNSVQTETDIGSTSHGTSVTRKESRALNEAKKRRLDKGKLVFEIDECAGRIVGKDSQRFITKGGCLVREYAMMDGTTWKKQPDSLKTDIISKCVENSTFNRKCERSFHAIDSQLGNQHKNWHYKLHVRYKEFPTHEEAMVDPPSGIELPEWVKLCQKFASEKFQKLSAQNKKNRSFNVIPPTVGTKSTARRMDTKRRQGEEVTVIDGYEISHYSEKNHKMVNEEAEAVLKKLRSEEAAGSGTPVEICLKVLKHVPGHLRGRSAPKKEILAVENLRTTMELEKKKSAALEEEVRVLKEEQVKHQKEQASFKVEQEEMKKNMGLMMQEIKRLSGLVSQNSGD